MDNSFAKGLIAGGAAATLAAVAFHFTGICTPKSPSPSSSGKPAKAAGEASTTDSGLVAGASGGAGNVYETQKAVSEYLLFHYGTKEDILGDKPGPESALEFPRRTAEICARFCRENGVPMKRALDVGCAVGAASFHLSSHFDEVVGVDFSQAFVDAATSLQTTRRATFTMVEEAEIKKEGVARVPSGTHPERCSFEQGDACNLRSSLGKFSVIHASNLLCRLPDPAKFLSSLHDLLEPNGIVVLVSPYSWMPGYTEKTKWMGGFVEDGKPHYSTNGVKELLEPQFKLIHTDDTPFLIREHARKFQWGCSECTVWKKR